MMDLMKSLQARYEEISAYISEVQREREHLLSRLSEIDQGTAEAERDLRRVQRSMQAWEGADEPKESTMPTIGVELTGVCANKPVSYRPGE